MKVTWNDKNKAKLHMLYNKGLADKTICDIYGTTIFAIAKQRSNMGLVSHKQKRRRYKESKIIIPQNSPDNIIHYKDSRNIDHFMQGEKMFLVEHAKNILRHKHTRKIVLYTAEGNVKLND